MSDYLPEGNGFIAVVGGGVAGAEAAAVFARQGINVAVFDQNILPYGKLEDGLPKWHAKLRDKEEKQIDIKLNHPLVHYIPKTCVGKDIDFAFIAREMKYSAVIIAVGAWKDRHLPVSGIDEFTGSGLYYQNDFISRFNHCHEPGFRDGLPEIPDGAIVIGGGLASLDVAKVIMIETVQKALAKKNILSDIFSLEGSIASVLSSIGFTLEGLGLKGCTLFYRKRIGDMPLTSIPATTPEEKGKAEQVRTKIVNNFREKYLFRVEECAVPVDKMIEGGKLSGIIFRKSIYQDGHFTEIPGSEKSVRTPMVISSIGSIPAPIEGIPYADQMFVLTDMETCRVKGYDHVFTTGNAVTGRGNIFESAKHARKISEYVLHTFLQNTIPLSTQQYEGIIRHIRNLQSKAGYSGNYLQWVNENRPVRLESMERSER